MGDAANILVVSDLHFGEELLPGASLERRQAVELGAAAFRDFLRYHAVRRSGGRPWRLVIAGDLFDFMSVVIPARPAPGERAPADERRFGVGRTTAAGVERMRLIAELHAPLLAEMVRFAAAGHRIDIVVGNHDVELLAPEVAAELMRHLAFANPDPKVVDPTAPPTGGASRPARGALERIAIVPWFVYVPGVAWIEHGHVYDEGCSFEFNLAPTDPADGVLVFNADYAAVRYLGTAVPEIDPHGIEEWSFWGFMQYSWGQGLRSFGKLWVAYARFSGALFAARRLHRSLKRRHRRQMAHRTRLARVAADGGLALDHAERIDHLARSPMTYSFRRLGRMVMLDRFGLVGGALLVAVLGLVLLPRIAAWIVVALAIAAVIGVSRWLGQHHVTSQIPMRSIPQRLRGIVDAPVVVFGHTHDPRWQVLRDQGLYVNAGTWLPATRPGLRRSFTHVLIVPRAEGRPVVELRQWRDGSSMPFDAGANLGAGGMTDPHIDISSLKHL